MLIDSLVGKGEDALTFSCAHICICGLKFEIEAQRVRFTNFKPSVF